MCGIIGYIGKKEALPILIKGLRRLEYRGYDSAGVAILEGSKIKRIRSVGRIENLADKVKDEKFARDVFSSQLGSYFEDLESAIYTKTRLEDVKRKKDRKKF